MKKMTKLAVTVAAMSAMTIAAATMVSADGKYNSIANEKPATGISDGEWGGNNTDGWTFTVDGIKVKGWNQIDGVWYYFHANEIMAREELVYLNGHTYYFNTDGSMMANGWVGFDDESDILYDYGLNVEENIEDINNPVETKAENAYDTVWMYFSGNGTAIDDEWYQADSGLWYYFDDIIMACADFDHEIGGNYYGFDEDGAMLVGWAKNLNTSYIQAPNKEEDCWYYYNSDGKKFNVQDKNSGYGWKKIDDSWYCFYAQAVGNVGGNTVNEYGDITVAGGITDYFSVGTMISNAYFANGVTGQGNEDYYYVDKKGAMATGVTVVAKDAILIGSFDGSTYTWNDRKADGKSNYTKLSSLTDDKTWEVYFNNDGKAQANKFSGTSFYAAAYDSSSAKVRDTVSYLTIGNDSDETAAVSNYKTNCATIIKGALVKSAFVKFEGDIYYVDKYGDKVTTHAVEVGSVIPSYTNTKLDSVGSGSIYNTNTNVDRSAGEYHAYTLFDNKGIAYDDIEVGRTVKVGSKKYTAIGTYQTGIGEVNLFFYENEN